MSEYQRMKARALALQREKEAELKREIAEKAKREAQVAKEEAERRRRLEMESKEARRKELMAANAALHQSTSSAAAAGNYTYDPFAEDARPGPSKIVPKKPAPKPTTNGRAANGKAPSTAARAPSKAKSERKSSPQGMGRKERTMQSIKRSTKQSAADSIFSVQALVSAHEGSPRASPGAPRPSSPRKPVAPAIPRPRTAAAPPGKKGIVGVKKGLDVSGLRKLCPDRDTRDRRTLDEIQRDIRARKAATSAAASPARAAAPDPRGAPPRKKKQYRSSSDSESDSDSPPRRKRARGTPPFRAEPDRATVSAMIQGMFNRGRAPRKYDDDSDVSDMEAGLDDVLREERRAAKIARLEDEAAEREEAAHRAAKERLKRERMKKGAGAGA